jgi:hypothetical protein
MKGNILYFEFLTNFMGLFKEVTGIGICRDDIVTRISVNSSSAPSLSIFIDLPAAAVELA